MTTAMSACVAMLLDTKFNDRAPGRAIEAPYIRTLFAIPGIPSADPGSPVPAGLTAATSASIRRMWDHIALSPIGERLELFSKPIGHDKAQKAYRHWFRYSISGPMNKKFDAFLGDVSPLHIIAHNAITINTDPDPIDDADIFATPTILGWPSSQAYPHLGAHKLLEELDIYVSQTHATNPDSTADKAASDLVKNVWSRHKKAWQRAKAVVFGESSSNATAPAMEDTLWYELVEVMKGKQSALPLPSAFD